MVASVSDSYEQPAAVTSIQAPFRSEVSVAVDVDVSYLIEVSGYADTIGDSVRVIDLSGRRNLAGVVQARARKMKERCQFIYS